MRQHNSIRWIASLILIVASSFSSAENTEKLHADIRWTAHGIPHIKASNEKNLGFGVGYAYARDNACLLIDEVITVRGERSRFFGAGEKAPAKLDNITSDFFYAWLNNPLTIKQFWESQPDAIQKILTGYAIGFNQYLQTPGIKIQCAGEPWVQPIAADDLLRLARRMLVSGGAGQFAEAIVNAAPPGKPVASIPEKNINDQWLAATVEKFKPARGSNAVAVGKSRSADGKGILLANPHFPWTGGSRFYQMHLTIPGQLDVMGASLPGFPFINIGFNQSLAWTHTVDTSTHFTVFKLTLDKADPTRYIVDGKSIPLEKKKLSIHVRDNNGKLSEVSRTIFESTYGPIVIWPKKLVWNKKEAYAIRDANFGNNRLFQQWYAINQAQDIKALRASVEKIQGIPWVNTLAVDKQAKTLYMNQSVIPYLQPKQLQQCTVPQLAALGLPGLIGNDSTCDWSIDSVTVQAGITPPSQLPTLERDDFVQNSNDSAWLTNPAAPLKGYSLLVNSEGNPLKLRTRFGLTRLQGDQKLTPELLEKMVFDNQVYLADLIKEDLVALCKQFAQNKPEVSLTRACSILTSWDGKANPSSNLGVMYLYFFADYFYDIEDPWKIPFDKHNPVTTPSGIALDDSKIAKGIRQALIKVDEEIQSLNLPAQATWGDVQVAIKGTDRIAIPGAHGTLGVYNAIESDEHDALLEAVGGTSYIQLVTLGAEGPQARGLLAFSQSSDKTSKYYRDQTDLFSQGKLVSLPFTDVQINADPLLVRLELKQQ